MLGRGVKLVGDVGNAAEVQTGAVVAEEEPVADGHERRALSAEGHVELAEVEYDGKARFSSYGVAVADLSGEVEVRLMEDGVAVRGDEIDWARVVAAEEVDSLPNIVAEFHVDEGIFIGRGVF